MSAAVACCRRLSDFPSGTYQSCSVNDMPVIAGPTCANQSCHIVVLASVLTAAVISVGNAGSQTAASFAFHDSANSGTS